MELKKRLEEEYRIEEERRRVERVAIYDQYCIRSYTPTDTPPASNTSPRSPSPSNLSHDTPPPSYTPPSPPTQSNPSQDTPPPSHTPPGSPTQSIPAQDTLKQTCTPPGGSPNPTIDYDKGVLFEERRGAENDSEHEKTVQYDLKHAETVEVVENFAAENQIEDKADIGDVEDSNEQIKEPLKPELGGLLEDIFKFVESGPKNNMEISIFKLEALKKLLNTDKFDELIETARASHEAKGRNDQEDLDDDDLVMEK